MADYAWMLAAAPDPAYRDPHRAIGLANELIRNSPKVRDVWTTLGVAHYRSGSLERCDRRARAVRGHGPRTIHRRQRLLPGDGLLATR